jgi:hypothetical protein
VSDRIGIEDQRTSGTADGPSSNVPRHIFRHRITIESLSMLKASVFISLVSEEHSAFSSLIDEDLKKIRWLGLKVSGFPYHVPVKF